MKINEAIRQTRKIKGLTQSQLAEKSGVKQSAIAKYETGAREPSADIINQLSRALECDLFALLNDSIEDKIDLATDKMTELTVAEIVGMTAPEKFIFGNKGAGWLFQDDNGVYFVPRDIMRDFWKIQTKHAAIELEKLYKQYPSSYEEITELLNNAE